MVLVYPRRRMGLSSQALVAFGSGNDLDDVSLETRLMTINLGASF